MTEPRLAGSNPAVSALAFVLYLRQGVFLLKNIWRRDILPRDLNITGLVADYFGGAAKNDRPLPPRGRGSPFQEWMESYNRQKIYGIILARIKRVEGGNLGDCEPVGEGVSELKIDVGPGYRVYFGQDGDEVVLLYGGTKETQDKDIKTAKEYWRDYNA